jgi:hypothetical protein
MMSNCIHRIALPLRQRAQAVDYLGGGCWRIWLSTTDFKHGTYLKLYMDGTADRIDVFEDQADEVERIAK